MVLVVDDGLVIVHLCAYSRYHHFVAILQLSLVLTLRPREVLVWSTGLQVYALTVVDHHVLNFKLNNLAIVFAVVEVAGRDNLRLLNKNIIEALFAKGAATEGNGGVT